MKLKEKRILLTTLEGGLNYGNRLQHYALKHSLEKAGYTVDSLMIRGKPESGPLFLIKQSIMTILKAHFIRRRARLIRRKKAASFNRKYIGNMIYMPVDEVRKTNWEQYDFAVTGSDQVWHNWHTKGINDELSHYYLEFINPDKRVSYAPSFGFTEFPEKDVNEHMRGLMDMRALSCREQEGCDLIYQLTGRKAQKVLDPTLLLSPEDWVEIEEDPGFALPEHYLVQFFLGHLSDDYRIEIDRIKKEMNLKIVDLQDETIPEMYGLSPNEFIWMIHHADVVCTDSFHATVFSILFERKLRVFERITPEFGNMFGRLHDLLEPLGLMDNVYGVGYNISTLLSRNAKAEFEQEIKKSIQYMRYSLQHENLGSN